jgi:DNA mismatch repair protein MSH2
MEDREEIVLAIVVKEATASLPISCAIACFNKATRHLTVCEFNDTSLLPTAESILLQINPRAITALCQNGALANQLVAVARTVSDTPVEILNGSVGITDSGLVEADLQRLLKKSEHQYDWTNKSDLSQRAFSILTGHYRLLSNVLNHRACTLSVTSGDGIFLKLDRATFNALNLFPTIGGIGAATSTTSLFGLLNKCKTRMGSRRLQLWMRQPLVDIPRIRERQDIVESLVNSARVRQLVQGSRFSRVPDLDVISTKLAQNDGVVTLEDLVKVYEGIVSVNCLIDDFRGLQNETVNTALVEPLEEAVRNMEGFMRLVESTLDLEAASCGDFRVDAKFDPNLGSIAEERNRIRKEMESLRSKVPSDNVRIVDCLAPYLKAFRVSRKQMASVSGTSKYRQVQINKAEYLFTSDKLMDLVDDLIKVEKDYEKKSSVVVKKIVSVASTYFSVVSELAELLGTIDILTSFAVVASMCKLTRPVLVEPPIDKSLAIGDLDLRRCRHLLVELRSLELFGTDYIPNDVRMKPEENIQIITGPNMGGKSTYIRSVAMAVLLNQIGCFVPCDSGSRFPIFESIMCRVGASDAQVRGISTFMQEMIEAATIVNSANNRSLVIIDELGRGTSTQDGFGLAWAISKFLKEQSNSFVFFATHFHELSQLPGATNRHVAACVTNKKLTLLYEVRDGPTSNSFGPNVAALAGYPPEVVEDAIMREKRLVLASDG